MRTAVILLPPVVLLLLPLVLGAVLYRRSHPGGSRRYHVRRAAAAFATGAVLTAALASPLVVWGGWCRATPRGSVRDADSFVVLGFGLGPESGGRKTAGASNRSLAAWLVEHNPGRRPTVVQEGVYLALAEMEADRPGLLKGWPIVRLPEPEGVYVDTSGAAFQAATVLHLHGRTRPVLVAHDLQLQRVAWSFEDAGVRDLVVPDLPPIPFDPNSAQHPGTRWKPVWLAREVLARPVTLCPQAAVVAVALIGAMYGAAACRVWGNRDG